VSELTLFKLLTESAFSPVGSVTLSWPFWVVGTWLRPLVAPAYRARRSHRHTVLSARPRARGPRMSVRMKPGATPLTRTVGASSKASCSTSPTTACFEAV
jgi:hypothetical protein